VSIEQLVADLEKLAPTDTSTEEEAWQALRVLKGEAFTMRVLRRYVLKARVERFALMTKRLRLN
jgi:hypothetical protein